MFICLQCALKEFVESLERGEDPLLQSPTTGGHITDESMPDHARRVHGTEAETIAERRDLEERAAAGEIKLRRRHRAMAANANNN